MIAVRGIGTLSSGTSSATPSIPAGTVANDVMILVCTAWNGDFTALSPLEMTDADSGDWARITTDSTVVGMRGEVWWKRAVGSDTAPTISMPAGEPGGALYARMISYSGCVQFGTPYEQATTTGGNGGTWTVNPINTLTFPNRLIVAGGAHIEGLPTDVTGMTPDPQLQFSSSGGGSGRIFLFDAADADGGATGT